MLRNVFGVEFHFGSTVTDIAHPYLIASGANLRGLNLVGSNLTKAEVTGTRVGNNSDLPDADKRDLRSRGAIFLDLLSSDVPSLVLR